MGRKTLHIQTLRTQTIHERNVCESSNSDEDVNFDSCNRKDHEASIEMCCSEGKYIDTNLTDDW